jgi:hypothetical protein
MPIIDRDLDKADLVLLELPRARTAPLKQSLEIIDHLAHTTGNNGSRTATIENAQADAWLAICTIAQKLEREERCPDERWDKAVALSQRWRALLI